MALPRRLPASQATLLVLRRLYLSIPQLSFFLARSHTINAAVLADEPSPIPCAWLTTSPCHNTLMAPQSPAAAAQPFLTKAGDAMRLNNALVLVIKIMQFLHKGYRSPSLSRAGGANKTIPFAMTCNPSQSNPCHALIERLFSSLSLVHEVHNYRLRRIPSCLAGWPYRERLGSGQSLVSLTNGNSCNDCSNAPKPSCFAGR